MSFEIAELLRARLAEALESMRLVSIQEEIGGNPANRTYAAPVVVIGKLPRDEHIPGAAVAIRTVKGSGEVGCQDLEFDQVEVVIEARVRANDSRTDEPEPIAAGWHDLQNLIDRIGFSLRTKPGLDERHEVVGEIEWSHDLEDTHPVYTGELELTVEMPPLLAVLSPAEAIAIHGGGIRAEED